MPKARCQKTKALHRTAAAQAGRAKVVCFGDSITNRGYFKVLEELLDIESINAGKGGHSSAMGLRRLQSDVMVHDPDLVVVMFGTNDLRADSERVFVPVDKYKENLQAIMTSCREHGSKVVLCTLPPINEQKFFTRHEREPFAALGGFSSVVQRYCNAAREVASEHDVPLVDLNRLLAKQPEWLSQDGVHPSETGTRLIAEHIAKAVQAVIGGESIGTAPQ
ncbi:SGNH/GDSL hydrolase family protein [Stieleria neptunia]|uniref:SGNH/GDSL hydrolase family protein n=1 Tax=Stieleria neptunia TaxID=2527979 RepID=UPI001E3972E7|nr:GDSL-type esterase/lipase family protein [Stieleria neptunia]